MQVWTKYLSVQESNIEYLMASIIPAVKPKFVPKLPPKREKVEPTPPVVSDTKPLKTSSSNQTNYRAYRDGGRGGRNVRTHAAPMQGAVFFRGINAVGHRPDPRSSYSGISSSGTSNAPASLPGNILKSEPGVAKSPMVRERQFMSMEGDSDGDSIDGMEEETSAEVWPPTAYDSTAPVSLPRGPNVSFQELLAQRPLFADPHDGQAMLDEEFEQIFLVQLPSSLLLNRGNLKPESETSSSSSTAAVPLLSGKIGKVQVMKSGRMYLVLTSGHKYQLNSGLPTSFAQYLVSKVLDDASALKVKEEFNSSVSSGSLHILGGITQKIVVTDTFL